MCENLLNIYLEKEYEVEYEGQKKTVRVHGRNEVLLVDFLLTKIERLEEDNRVLRANYEGWKWEAKKLKEN